MMNFHRIVAIGASCALIATLAFAQTRTVRFKLESKNYRRSEKRIDNRGVRLVRRTSKSPCIQGRSWGYDSRRVWVDKGCVADFSVVVRTGGVQHRPRPPHGRPPIHPPVRPPRPVRPPVRPPHGGRPPHPGHGKPPKPGHGGKPPRPGHGGKPPHPGNGRPQIQPPKNG